MKGFGDMIVSILYDLVLYSYCSNAGIIIVEVAVYYTECREAWCVSGELCQFDE